MKFSHEQLFGFLRSPVKDEIIDHTRWAVMHYMVFEYEGRLFQTFYNVGATENQDHMPWDYDADPLECQEVRAVERVIIEYEKVSE